MRRITLLAAYLAAGLLVMLAIVMYADHLANTTGRAQELKHAAEAGCVIDGQLLPEVQGDC